MSQRLRVLLKAQIDSAGGPSYQELALQTGVDRRRLADIADGRARSLKLDEIEALMVWARAHGHQSLFSLDPHPIWRTFVQTNARLLPSGQHEWDGQVTAELDRYLKGALGCTLDPQSTTSFEDGEEEARALVSSRNCVFIGAPKRNRATRDVLDYLLGDTRVVFRWPDYSWPARATDESGQRLGIRVRLPSGRRAFPINWLPEAEYVGSDIDDGSDAALLVVRRWNKPPQVSSIVIAGYTGFATRCAARELIFDRVPMSELELQRATGVNEPVIRVANIKYKKRAHSRRHVVASVSWWPH